MTTFEPFVEGWDFVETLGEGAYGEVRLAINRKTQEALAVKIVLADKLQGNKDNLKKEVCIHRMLEDKHIVKFYGQRTEKDRIYLFLEYAPGGELFDRIEPDIGMQIAQASKYFKQLIAGMEYIHSKGVTHRDVKPENLLIDMEGNLKITDFGLSTVYKYKEKERLLERCCGTPPYVAPEVLSQKQYKAEPADIWSCGIVLTAMLAGELPWDEPSDKCKEYTQWVNSQLLVTPWTKIDTLSLGFLKKILHPQPSKRYNFHQIKKDKWFLRSYSTLKSKSPRSGLGMSPSDSPAMKRHCSNTDGVSTPKNSSSRVSLSQPQPSTSSFDKLDSGFDEGGAGEPTSAGIQWCWYSQPLHVEDMLVSQISSTPGSSQNPFAHLAKRMTRFNVNTGKEDTLKNLCKVLEGLSLSHKIVSQNRIRVTTVDRRKTRLSYFINFIEINQRPLQVDFRRSQGDGIEFKRHFKNIKNKMMDYIV